jgi:hypothetical protein
MYHMPRMLSCSASLPARPARRMGGRAASRRVQQRQRRAAARVAVAGEQRGGGGGRAPGAGVPHVGGPHAHPPVDALDPQRAGVRSVFLGA